MKIYSYSLMVLKVFMYRFLFLMLPMKSKYVFFESYWGKSKSCNPKAISDFLINNTDYTVIWSVNNPDEVEDSGEIFCVRKSLKYFYYMAVSSFFVNNVNFPIYFKKRKKATFIQTKHGTPLKIMGFDELKYKKKSKFHYFSLKVKSIKWDYVISSNSYSTQRWKEAFPFDYEVIEVGYPRNDTLIQNKKNDELILKIKEKLGIDKSDLRDIILFAPTFREYHDIPNYYLDIAAFSKKLEDKFNILIRAHYFKKDNAGLSSVSEIDNVYDVSQYNDIEELYLVSDLLLTDYSSSMFDFANLKKPIVLYVPDYDEYETKRGLYFDVRPYFSSCVACNQYELEYIFLSRKYNNKDHMEKFSLFHEEFCILNDGKSTKEVCSIFFNIRPN